MNLFHLVPALCVPFGTSALPSVASAWTTGNHPALRRNIESVLKLTAIVALPAGLGIAVLAEPILTLLYPARTAEIMIAAPLLRLMGISAIFVALTSPTNSMLQAIGRQDLPVKLILLGAGIKLTINWVLIAQPGINILGAPVGSIACYAVMAGLSIFSLIRRSQTKLSLCSVLLRPALAAGLCAVGAWVSYSLLIRVLTNSPAVLLSIAVAAAIYFVALFACKAVGPEEIRMLPKGEKILLLLEKKGIIG